MPAGEAAATPVLRNAIWLIGAQVLAAPLSVLINAVAGRYLGPRDFGTFYLVTTYSAFALLFVEWGQYGALTGKIATQRARAGELLGSAMFWRACAGVAVAAVVLALCALGGYPRSFLYLMALMLTAATLATVATAGQDAVRGFERTDFAALTYLGQQLLLTLVSISVLALGFGLRGLLLGQILCAATVMVFVFSMLPRLQIPRLLIRRDTLRELFVDGRPFLAFVLVIQLQPLVDSAMMSRFASAEAIGWFAASRKLTGVFIFPALAVAGALYPTLVRQFATDRPGVRTTVHGALRAMCLAVFPVTIGCALFPQLGVMIFNAGTFAPAEQNVRLLALWLFLLYFSMPLSACINASGRQGRWAAIQFSCVIISAVADPFLIGWFQSRYGNGGLGVCITSAGSEVLMLGAALLVVPKGVLDASLLRLFAKPALAGLVMIGVGLVVGRYNALLGAIVAVISYVATLWLAGELRGEQLRSLRGALRPRAA